MKALKIFFSRKCATKHRQIIISNIYCVFETVNSTILHNVQNQRIYVWNLPREEEAGREKERRKIIPPLKI